MSDATSVLFGLEHEFSVLEVQRLDVTTVKVIIEQVAREGPCPECGVVSGTVKDRPWMRLKDLPVSGQTVELCWRKRRLICGEGLCPRKTFTQVSAAVRPRARVTERLRQRVAMAIASGNRAVAEVAVEYGVSWPTAHKALVAAAARWLPVKERDAMFEDAPVKAGAVQWPDADSAFWTVRRMQIKLHRWASEDHARRFGDLFNLVYDPAFLVHAWERVSSNAGARTPGVDRATVAHTVSRVGVEVFLGQIRDSLKSGGFEPVEVRRVVIPKASGKTRKLGIPTVADRVVQASLKAVLEPIFEADFKPCSYGFRPNRRAQDAIAEIHFLASHSYEWVLEADIQACFDEIGHMPLLARMRHRIKDKQILGLVKAFLKSGVMATSGSSEETLTGTPQGGILSPLLANIALSALDDHFDRQRREQMGTDQQRAKRKRNGLGNWKIVRYADDFVVMVSGQASTPRPCGRKWQTF